MDQKDEVKSKVDLVEVIASYIPLKKMGRNFAGLCPFHSEKTPSFMVSAERQAFKCFGCNESGDVYTFLEKMEGWDFREALEEMAKKAGVVLADFKPSGVQKNKEKLIEINKKALQFYKYLLNKHPIGETARKYLISRGVTQEFWEKFDLGYAPAGWENLSKFLKKRGYDLADMATAGLMIARLMVPRVQASGGQGRDTKGPGFSEGGYYDRFRNRIIFPLKDGRGTVLGFSGRTIDDAQKEAPLRSKSFEGQAKYINSPETSIYNKGSLLFGLDVARGAIRDKKETVLVEGEFDVISAHKAGVFNVVASKGTALTERQVVILSRLAEKVVLCFDTDLAGDAAARRGIELLDLAGLDICVVRLGKHKDPDDFAQKDPAGFKKAISNALNVYDYFLESATARYDPKTADGKKKIGQEILPVLARISDDLVRAHYTDKLARVLDLEVTLVAAAVDKKMGSLFTTLQTGGVGASVKSKLSLEEYFLALFISQDEIVTSFVVDVKPGDFENEKAASFWKWLRDIIRASQARTGHRLGEKPKSLKRLLEKLPGDLGSFVDHLYLANISPAFGEKEFWAQEVAKIAQRIKKESLKRQLFEVSRRLKTAQAEKNMRKMTILTKRFDQIAKYLKS
ncbi:hypothetical protein A3G16_03675 [Candidatus Curtissbacteria bacterium RIFCSPLOWO2_12_FULL_41_16]|nr:MAG: hypothetical protein A3G16_03675 [Candidatus Curtissbacteria bacterium RIFCSPLOWO2_12_FULL_41_16]